MFIKFFCTNWAWGISADPSVSCATQQVMDVRVGLLLGHHF